jgi:hypothetical protein
MPALQELSGGSVTEVLPTLNVIFLEGLEPSGPIQEGLGKFVATRQVTSHRIAISGWDTVRYKVSGRPLKGALRLLKRV